MSHKTLSVPSLPPSLHHRKPRWVVLLVESAASDSESSSWHWLVKNDDLHTPWIYEIKVLAVQLYGPVLRIRSSLTDVDLVV